LPFGSAGKKGVVKEKEMFMKQIKLTAAFILMAIVVTSCSTTPVCVTSSLTPMAGKTVTENLGKCEGSDTAFSFLGLFMFGRPDLDLAIQDALREKGGDTMINIRCYETSRWFLLLGTNTVTVEGEAVKLGLAEAEKKGKTK